MLVAFPFVEKGVSDHGTSIRHLVHGQEQMIRIGETMLLPLNDEIMLLLQRPGTSIALAESESFVFKICFKGHIQIDPLLVGRLMVYYEMGQKRLNEGPLADMESA